jgi:hypothetical protein
LAWRVLLVVCWLSCRGGPVWMGMHRRQRPPSGPRWVWRSRCNLLYKVMIIVVLVRDELRDNHHVRPRTSGDLEGCLNRARPRKCAGQRGTFIASGRRGRGFKSRHPDNKTPAQRLCAIESRWSRVTNCVTIGSFFRWCIPAVRVFSAVHDGGRLPVAASGTETRRRP